MTFRLLPVPVFGDRTALQGAGLRIAIPAWRWQSPPETATEDAPYLSREELQNLFVGELSPRDRKRAALTAADGALAPRRRNVGDLTDAEIRDRDMGMKLRRALYPGARRHH